MGEGKVSVYPWQETRSTPVGPHVRQRREYVFGIPGIIFGHSGGCGYLAATRRKKYPRDRVPLPLFSLFFSLFLRSMILREGGRGLSWNEVDQWAEEVERRERRGRRKRKGRRERRRGSRERGPPVTSLTFYRYPVDWAENLTNWFRPFLPPPPPAPAPPLLACPVSSLGRSSGSRSAAGYAIGQLTQCDEMTLTIIQYIRKFYFWKDTQRWQNASARARAQQTRED